MLTRLTSNEDRSQQNFLDQDSDLTTNLAQKTASFSIRLTFVQLCLSNSAPMFVSKCTPAGSALITTG